MQTLVLDGEVCVYDEKLVSRFHLLGDDESGILRTPPLFIAFDVLQVGCHDVRRSPLHERAQFSIESRLGASETSLS